MKRLFLSFLAMLVYAVLWCVGLVVLVTPFRLRDAMARALAGIWFVFVPFRRDVILHNLARVFPRREAETMNDFRRRTERLGRANMAHVVHCLLEIFERTHWTKATVARKVEVVGMAHMDRLRAEKRGFFVLSAHIGNWELMTVAGAILGVPLVILTKYLRNPFFDRLWVRSRLEHGLELIEERHAGRALVRELRAAKAIGFVLDQYTGAPHGLPVPFLGVPTWCAKGLAVIALRTESPVVPCHILRLPDGRFRISIEPPLEQVGRTGSGPLSDDELSFHIRLCNEKMEAWIHSAPEQYLWLHKRFKGQVDYTAPLPWRL